MEIPEAAGQRFLAAVDPYSNHQIAKIIKENFSDLASRLHEQVAVPNTGSRFMLDTSPMKNLGISFKPLKDSVIDTVSSVLERGWPAQQRLCLTVLRKLSSPKAHALYYGTCWDYCLSLISEVQLVAKRDSSPNDLKKRPWPIGENV
ncbi:hypothetical protein COH20_002090 [Aspergillus flavus]|nr:hypothetical protein COH20_002090 [Aspergillus flavus]RAQ79794.1 hypothetical protein COH21_006103 [Aspergillus flavus]